MSNKVTLDLDGKSFEVLRCLCKCEQQSDKNGSPSSGVVGGYISLLMAGSAEDTFASWMSDPQQTKDGTIDFSVQDSSFKKIEFKKAFIVKLHESFNGEAQFDLDRLERTTTQTSEDPAEQYIYEQILHYQSRTGTSYVMQCTISAEKISIDGVDHDNNWGQ
jgi:hypothetical protein